MLVSFSADYTYRALQTPQIRQDLAHLSASDKLEENARETITDPSHSCINA